MTREINPMSPRKRSQRGNAMLEFALAFSIIVPVFLGTFQFGYTFYVYNLLQTQVRDGARYAALRTFRAGDAHSIAAFSTAVRNMVRYSTPDGTESLIVPGLADSNVIVSVVDRNGVAADASHVPATVKISINNFSLYSVVNTTTFNQHPNLQFTYAGRYAPAETE
jgi:Flp pilus assembly protein TadG